MTLDQQIEVAQQTLTSEIMVNQTLCIMFGLIILACILSLVTLWRD